MLDSHLSTFKFKRFMIQSLLGLNLIHSISCYKPHHAYVFQDWYSNGYAFEWNQVGQETTNSQMIPNHSEHENTGRQVYVNESSFICYETLFSRYDAFKEETETRIETVESEKEWIFKAWDTLNVLTDKCLEFGNRIKYRYCHGDNITQFISFLPEDLKSLESETEDILELQEDTAIVEDGVEMSKEKKSQLMLAFQYVIGQFSTISLNELDTNAIEPSVSLVRDYLPGKHYLRMYWRNGDVCEEIMEKRVVEIQYHCCQDEHISYVSEVATCKYVMYVHSPALCQLDIFKPNPPLKPSTRITCQSHETDESTSNTIQSTRQVLSSRPLRDPVSWTKGKSLQKLNVELKVHEDP